MSVLIFRGIPTKPDVDRLCAIASSRKTGEIVSWAEIESTLGEKRHCHRAKAVVQAWKKRMFRESNVLLVSVMHAGYKLAIPSERISECSKLVATGRRRIVRASVVATATAPDELSTDEKRLREHLLMIPAKLKLAELTAAPVR